MVGSHSYDLGSVGNEFFIQRMKRAHFSRNAGRKSLIDTDESLRYLVVSEQQFGELPCPSLRLSCQKKKEFLLSIVGINLDTAWAFYRKMNYPDL